MTGDALLAALDLPAHCRVDQRVPKKLLLENGAPTAADKRIINEGVEELQWVAALKPTTIGVPAYRDEAREYLEVAVLHLDLRPEAKATRLQELVHRAVPYPLLLVAEHGERVGLSAAHKRWSQGELGKTVLDGEVVAVDWAAGCDDACGTEFRDALVLGRQSRVSLLSLYQSWIDTLHALQAARLTGRFAVAANAARAAARRDALRELAQLEAEIARLRASAAKETQMSRRVDLNLELERVEAAQTAARANL